MPRALKIAAIQMDVTPAPTADRLARAEQWVTQAAQAGAQLVVLPEVFNTGYAYASENYQRAETLSGPTALWLKDTAARLNIHLAGTLLLRDGHEIYNALLLCAPDGRQWRYDKNYPAGWERAYFRPSNRITVAQTSLGNIGLMICWDTAHPKLWRRYAGKIDLMLVCSSPPQLSQPTYYFPNGAQITLDELGPVIASAKGEGQQVFGQWFNQQAAWLGAPAVNTVACGRFESGIPNSLTTFLAFLPLAPWQIKHLPQAARMRMSCQMVTGCKVVNAAGQTLSEVSQAQGEGFALAEVTLADTMPQPRGPQPPMPISAFTRFSIDLALPLLTTPAYWRGLRRVANRSTGQSVTK